MSDQIIRTAATMLYPGALIDAAGSGQVFTYDANPNDVAPTANIHDNAIPYSDRVILMAAPGTMYRTSENIVYRKISDNPITLNHWEDITLNDGFWIDAMTSDGTANFTRNAVTGIVETLEANREDLIAMTLRWKPGAGSIQGDIPRILNADGRTWTEATVTSTYLDITTSGWVEGTFSDILAGDLVFEQAGRVLPLNAAILEKPVLQSVNITSTAVAPKTMFNSTESISVDFTADIPVVAYEFDTDAATFAAGVGASAMTAGTSGSAAVPVIYTLEPTVTRPVRMRVSTSDGVWSDWMNSDNSIAVGNLRPKNPTYTNDAIPGAQAWDALFYGSQGAAVGGVFTIEDATGIIDPVSTSVVSMGTNFAALRFVGQVANATNINEFGVDNVQVTFENETSGLTLDFNFAVPIVTVGAAIAFTYSNAPNPARRREVVTGTWTSTVPLMPIGERPAIAAPAEGGTVDGAYTDDVYSRTMSYTPPDDFIGDAVFALAGLTPGDGGGWDFIGSTGTIPIGNEIAPASFSVPANEKIVDTGILVENLDNITASWVTSDSSVPIDLTSQADTTPAFGGVFYSIDGTDNTLVVEITDFSIDSVVSTLNLTKGA